jgi:uncharacterized protein (DUF1330 family)
MACRQNRSQWEIIMPRGYWIAFYRTPTDPAVLKAYAELAGPAIAAAGGRFLARGGAEAVFEQGVAERTVLIEFESVAAALAAYKSERYQLAARILHGKADRDIRIVSGLNTA